MATSYDAVIVGARVAGAATAQLLARQGLTVLVVDREQPGRDTLSTHALMHAGVMQLERFGVLDDVRAAGTPAVEQVTFHYSDRAVPIHLGHRPLYAPRRTVLDPLLVAAAEAEGAEVWYGTTVTDLLRDAQGRVVGVRGHRDGQPVEVRADVTIGADGMRSRLARLVDAPVTRAGSHAAGFAYTYVDGVDTTGYEWCFAPGAAGGLIPTNDGLTCVWVGVPQPRFHAEVRHDLAGSVHRVLAEITPAVAARVAAGRRVAVARGFPGVPGWLRRPWGPGWALVGDAGSFKDPVAAHGMTDALRDAELLADAVHRWLRDRDGDAMVTYERDRDGLTAPLLDTADAIAGFGWDMQQVQAHHLALSEAMKAETADLAARHGALVG